MMPFLGGSQREWTETVDLLSDSYYCITADLPGFGVASSISGYAVSEMADRVVELLTSLHVGRYILVGHSMAGKVSAVVTRRITGNEQSLDPPEALILVAPSPPGPEPMSDSKRSQMLASLGSDSQLRQSRYSEDDRPEAERFVRNNIAHPIPEEEFKRTVDDVLKMNPAAWTAWLTSGSKEDWGSFVGTIDLPVLIVAGSHDEALGPESQRKHTLPHFSSAELVALDSSHLIPLEKPGELASLISTFLAAVSRELKNTGSSI